MCQTIAHCSVPPAEGLLLSALLEYHLGCHLLLQILAHHLFVENEISSMDHLLAFVILNTVTELIFTITDEGAFL